MEFLHKNWLTLLSLLISIVLAIALFFASKSERAPVFEVFSGRTLIGSTQEGITSKIKLVMTNGDPINGEVWALKFSFQNAGNASIRKEHLLEQLSLQLTGEDAEILDYRIIEESRPNIVKAQLAQDLTNSKGTLHLAFNILEQWDFIVGQIIYKGEFETSVKADGTIESVDRILTKQPTDYTGIALHLGKTMGYVVLFFAAMVAIVAFFAVIYKTTLKRIMPENIKHKLLKFAEICFFLIIGSIAILGTFGAAMESYKPNSPLSDEKTKYIIKNPNNTNQ